MTYFTADKAKLPGPGHRQSRAFGLATVRAALLAGALAAPGVAIAEEPADSLAAAYDEGAEPILVTARRREEDSQDVPVALSVVSSEALEKTGNFTLGQIQQSVPSLQVFSFNPRNTNINIRGLGSNVALTNDGLENGVGFYVDNVYYGRPGQSQFDLVDLQQIEVLRGPQGTLFGKNTTAGAINITTRLPAFDPELTAEATLGNYGYHQIRASGSAPLIADKAALRISIADTHRDGFLTNLHDGSKAQDYDNFSARAQLLLKPSDDFSIRLIGDYSHQKQHFVLNVPVSYFSTYTNGTTIANNFLLRTARAGYTPLPADPFARKGDSDAYYQSFMESYGVSGEVNWDLGPATITAVTAYRWWDWNPANDGDSTGLSVNVKAQQANRQRQFSQEVRIASNGGGRFDYVAGAYYFWQTVRGYGAFAYGSDAALWNLPTANQTIANAALGGFEANSVSVPTTRSLALFGQTDWKITDRLTLTTGLRYTHEKKDGSFSQFWVSGDDLSGLTPDQQAAAITIRNRFNPETGFTVSLKDDSVSGLATLGWKAGKDALLYASYARGNKSGGLNLSVLPAGAVAEVKPERVNNYEIGLKSQWLDRALTLNLAAFWTDVANYQTAITQPNALGTYVQYIANIPKVRSRGIEGDASWKAADWLSLNASASYVDAKYRSYANAPQAPEIDAASAPNQDLSGVQLAGVPKFTYTLGADLQQPLGGWAGDDKEVYLHADYSYRSSFNTSGSNSAYAQVPAFGLLNARIGVRDADGRWDLSVWARNLANKDYFQSLTAGATGLVTGIVGEPRTAGVTLRTSL